jgi:hypothetical protein
MELTIEELKSQADDLGISYSPNIGIAKLQSRIDEVLVEQEERAIEAQVSTPRVNKTIERPVDPEVERRKRIMQRALKRSKVIVYSNDPRDANKTTCMSSVRNSYFGDAKVIPLGQEWWLQQMHIDNLKNINIVKYIDDGKGNSKAVNAKKYTVDILETDEAAAKARLAKLARK